MPAEDREAGLDGLEGAEIAGFELVAGFLFQGALHRPVDAVAGVAHHGVQPAFRADDFIHDSLRVRGVVHVQADALHTRMRGGEGAPARSGIDFHAGIGQE